MTEAETYVRELPGRTKKFDQMFDCLVKMKPGTMSLVNSKDAEMVIKYLLDCRFSELSGVQFTDDYRFIYKY